MSYFIQLLMTFLDSFLTFNQSNVLRDEQMYKNVLILVNAVTAYFPIFE